MTTFLFWNTDKKDLTAEISAMCDEHDVDVVIIAEPNRRVGRIQSQLNSERLRKYSMVKYADTFTPLVLYRYPHSSMKSLQVERRFSIYKLILPYSRMEILITALHLPSKCYMKESDQAYFAIDVAGAIERIEHKVGHARTVIIGDFNMNPFEEGLTSAKTFHAVMDRKIAAGYSRSVQEQEYAYLYNPMWGRLGDNSKGPPGTHNFLGSYTSYFWDTYDQVLLRPELLDYFDDNSLKVIIEIGGQNLLKTKSPGINDKDFSDHLPFVVSLDLERMVADEYGTEKSLG